MHPKLDWTDAYTEQEIREMCSLPPPDEPWMERMKINPARRGWYWVRLSDGTERLMTYARSKKWDAGRERLQARHNGARVTHWKRIPQPPSKSRSNEHE